MMMSRIWLLAAVLIATGTVATASASTASTVPWTRGDMTAAVKAIGYPKPHPVRLTCRGLGTADASGRFPSFRCTATYRHSVRRRFAIAGRAIGGWLCAGKTLAGCTILRHGYVTGDPADGALVASRGYMAFRYNDPQPFRATAACQPSSQPLTWSFCYALDNSNVNVTVTLKVVRGGYATTVGTRLY